MDVIDGNWIKARLSGRRGEQSELARFVGINPDQLTKVLAGRRNVQPAEAPRVVAFFAKRKMSAPPTDIAARLEALIAEKGTNPRALALSAGLGPTGVRDILTGKTVSPKLATLQNIAAALRVDLSDLTNGPNAGDPPDGEFPHRSAGIDIARFRKMRGLTQRDVADMLGVDPATIHRAEAMHSSAKLATYLKYASALGVSLADLFRSEDGEGPLPAEYAPPDFPVAPVYDVMAYGGDRFNTGRAITSDIERQVEQRNSAAIQDLQARTENMERLLEAIMLRLDSQQ
jgi:transcriptional regulator with XRE-family HTH domain